MKSIIGIHRVYFTEHVIGPMELDATLVYFCFGESMDPRVEAGIKKFLTNTLTKWLGTIKTGDHDGINDSLDFIAVTIKDISSNSMFGSSLENTESGLEEIEYELGVLAKDFSSQRRSTRATQAKRYQQFAEKFVSEIQNST